MARVLITGSNSGFGKLTALEPCQGLGTDVEDHDPRPGWPEIRVVRQEETLIDLVDGPAKREVQIRSAQRREGETAADQVPTDAVVGAAPLGAF